jgi:hypothetical protein
MPEQLWVTEILNYALAGPVIEIAELGSAVRAGAPVPT